MLRYGLKEVFKPTFFLGEAPKHCENKPEVWDFGMGFEKVRLKYEHETGKGMLLRDSFQGLRKRVLK